MRDDLEAELSDWGRSETPQADGAFADRLETSLRRGMLDRSVGQDRGWLGMLFRPGVVVMAIAVPIFGLAFISRASDDVGFADGGDSTVPTPTTTDSSSPTISDQTTIPAVETTVPVTDSTTSTTDAPPPEVVATLATPANGRIAVMWRVGGDTSDVAGWVVVRTIGDSGQAAATVREATARRVVVEVVNRDALLRVEGRSAGGELVVQSDDVSINRDE